MTENEKTLARALERCVFFPGIGTKRFARDMALAATQSEPRPLIKGERLMLTGITVPSGATKDTRVWVVNRFHNRITTRKIGNDTISFGSFPSDIVSVTTTKGEAIKAMLEYRAAELNNAIREMARAERAMVSALKLASKEGAC